MSKILVFDIEASNLQANFGTTLCVGYKWVGKKRVHILGLDDFNEVCECCNRIKNPSDDKELVSRFAEVMAQADAMVSWYGKGFDIPFLQTRLLAWGLPPLPPVPHIDGCRDIAQKHLKLHSNRLAVVQEFLGLKDAKTPLTPEHWTKARNGELSGLRYVEEHCRKDVLVLEEAYLKLRQLMPRHPNVALMENYKNGCPTCGGQNLVAHDKRQGGYVTGTRGYSMLQCKDCGVWVKVPKSTISGGYQSLASGR